MVHERDVEDGGSGFGHAEEEESRKAADRLRVLMGGGGGTKSQLGWRVLCRVEQQTWRGGDGRERKDGC